MQQQVLEGSTDWFKKGLVEHHDVYNAILCGCLKKDNTKDLIFQITSQCAYQKSLLQYLYISITWDSCCSKPIEETVENELLNDTF